VSLTVAYSALLAGIVLWAVLVSKLRAKPWEAQVIAPEGTGISNTPPKRIGLWIFLAVITSLFCLFVSAYYMRMGGHAGHGPALNDWGTVNDPGILWFNTALLIIGSVRCV